ncbi:MAG: hypothetical protein M3024_01870 [Candidatus Dormibacteraeota bacterium]|nr:hypothetical protein [Candidatus Dormibacteraeota bacterium]
MDVTGPKGPAPFGGVDMLTWARNQLTLAAEILDNPGGGLLFATQTIGQVRSTLGADGARWGVVLALLAEAEDHAVRRRLPAARDLIDRALAGLPAVPEAGAPSC